MTTMKKISSYLGAGLMTVTLLTTGVNAAEDSHGAAAAASDTEYSLEEMLTYALEDERLAQAEYEAIMDAFDVTRPFSNIIKAEETHEAAVIGLFEARDWKLPDDFDLSGSIVIPNSLEEIYSIGVEAEINNIAMYEAFLEEDLDDDVRAVFEALMKASEYHLAAFQRGVDGKSIGAAARNGINSDASAGNGFGSESTSEVGRGNGFGRSSMVSNRGNGNRR